MEYKGFQIEIWQDNHPDCEGPEPCWFALAISQSTGPNKPGKELDSHEHSENDVIAAIKYEIDKAVKVTMIMISDGQSTCVDPTIPQAIEHITSLIENGQPGEKFTFTIVELTQLEFESLGDFPGW